MDWIVPTLIVWGLMALAAVGVWMKWHLPSSDYQRLNAIEIRLDALEKR